MNRLRYIYLKILEYGLLNIRELSRAQDVRLCEIEADHLHNIPSLVQSDNIERHRYYYDIERTSYLESIKSAGRGSECFAFRRYCELWGEMGKVINEITGT